MDIDNEIDTQVKALLKTTASHLAIKGKKKGFPHSYVFKGKRKNVLILVNCLSESTAGV